MNIQGSINQIDEVIAKELTIDLSSGAFYKEVDDETLQMALTAMYENIEGWNARGVIIGRGQALSRESQNLKRCDARLTCSRIEEKNFTYGNDISNTIQMDRTTRIAENNITNVLFNFNRMGKIKWQIYKK